MSDAITDVEQLIGAMSAREDLIRSVSEAQRKIPTAWDYGDDNDLIPPDPDHIRSLNMIRDQVDLEISFLQKKIEERDREIAGLLARMSLWNVGVVLEEAAVIRLYARGIRVPPAEYSSGWEPVPAGPGGTQTWRRRATGGWFYRSRGIDTITFVSDLDP